MQDPVTTPDWPDDRAAVDMIAARVVEALHADLESLINAADIPGASPSGLTVDQVAKRLGVARSTVYAHWREWGGYKLGRGLKAPVRFDPDQLPSAKKVTVTTPQSDSPPASSPPRARRPERRRRELIVDAPRLLSPLDDLA